MPFEIAMPQMGLTMEAGTILHWLKQVGDAVRRDEPLLEIETDKTAVEVTSDAEGVLLAILVPEGKAVPVGTVLGWIGQAGEVVPRASADAEAPAPSRAAAPAPVSSAGEPATPSAPESRVRATPAARSRARGAGVSLATHGMGLGLALSRSITERLGGGLSFDAAASITTFHLDLPTDEHRPQ